MSGRPEPLFPLFSAITILNGVGPKTGDTLEAAGISRPRDMLFTLPHAGIDRHPKASIRDVVAPATVTVDVEVGPHYPPKTRGRPYRVHVQDAQTEFQLVFFHARGDYLQKILPEGARRVVSGKLEMFDSIIQMTHPDHVLAPEEAGDLPTFEPVYPLTAGVTQKVMFKATRAALARAPELDEWIDAGQKAKAGWADWAEVVQQAHSPKSLADISAADPVRERLAYLRDHPDLSSLEPAVLEVAAQMSHVSKELADVYSDERVERARGFLEQRQYELQQFNQRLTQAKMVSTEMKHWLHEVELEEAVAAAQLDRLRDELKDILPELGLETVVRADNTVIEMTAKAAE